MTLNITICQTCFLPKREGLDLCAGHPAPVHLCRDVHPMTGHFEWKSSATNLCDDHAWAGQGECPECKVNDDAAFPLRRDNLDGTTRVTVTDLAPGEDLPRLRRKAFLAYSLLNLVECQSCHLPKADGLVCPCGVDER